MSTTAATAPTEGSVHAKLMREMGSKSGEWNPIAPQMHEALKDRRERPALRVYGALLDSTISRDNNGTRHAYALEPDGKTKTGTRALAGRLDMSESQVSEALSELEEEGKIRRADGKIYVLADVPIPEVEEKANNGRKKFLRTELTFNQAQEAFLVQIHTLSEENFTAAISRILGVKLWGQQSAADHMILARDEEAAELQQAFTELGYTESEKRGAKKKAPRRETCQSFIARNNELLSKIASGFTVQDGKITARNTSGNSARKPQPYRPESRDSESQLAVSKESDAKAQTPATNATTRKAEAEAGTARTEIRNEITARLHTAKLTTLGHIKIESGTMTTLVNEFMRLDAAGPIREVLDVLEERAREIATGKRVVDGWGYLVKTVRGEIDKRLDVHGKVKAAAAGKGKW